MGYKIILDSDGNPIMSYEQDDTIGTDLLLSNLVRQGSFFLDPTFGLRELPKKITTENLGLIKDSCKQSSKWLLDAGKAKSIEVQVDRSDNDLSRISIQQTAIQANDTTVEFITFVPVV